MRRPLTPDEIRNIDDYQSCHYIHSLKCGNDSGHAVLVASLDGLHCPDCDYKQTWVPDFIRDGRWREAAAKMDKFLSAVGQLQMIRKPAPPGPACDPSEGEV